MEKQQSLPTFDHPSLPGLYPSTYLDQSVLFTCCWKGMTRTGDKVMGRTIYSFDLVLLWGGVIHAAVSNVMVRDLMPVTIYQVFTFITLIVLLRISITLCSFDKFRKSGVLSSITKKYLKWRKYYLISLFILSIIIAAVAFFTNKNRMRKGIVKDGHKVDEKELFRTSLIVSMWFLLPIWFLIFTMMGYSRSFETLCTHLDSQTGYKDNQVSLNQSPMQSALSATSGPAYRYSNAKGRLLMTHSMHSSPPTSEQRNIKDNVATQPPSEEACEEQIQAEHNYAELQTSNPREQQ